MRRLDTARARNGDLLKIRVAALLKEATPSLEIKRLLRMLIAMLVQFYAVSYCWPSLKLERAVIKIVVVSDTHAGHDALGRLFGDVLIHCGDIALWGRTTSQDIANLDRWFARQDFRVILVTGGNHDFDLEKSTGRGDIAFRNATYLEDRRVAFEGINFYGAPWVPELRQWAYFQDGPALKKKWAAIPPDTDVLITHTPPSGILDVNSRGKSCGCPALRERLQDLHLRLHCFGHVHASAGVKREGETTYVNAAMVNHSYDVVRRPYEFEL